MDSLKQIMYGVTDFPLMRRENAYFIDHTALIPELEKTRYALFLRPRRFGKSLLCAILKCYYAIEYAGRFEEIFGGLDIGRNISLLPTFATLTGFSHSDIRTMLSYYRANAGFDFDENMIFETMCRWYDNYRFSPDPLVDADATERVPPQVANPTLVLNFMQYFLRNRKPPRVFMGTVPIGAPCNLPQRVSRHHVAEERIN